MGIFGGGLGVFQVAKRKLGYAPQSCARDGAGLGVPSGTPTMQSWSQSVQCECECDVCFLS